MLHTLFTTPHRATLLRNLRDLRESRSITASLDAFEAILDDLGQPGQPYPNAPMTSGETDAAYVFTLALPGFKKEQVKVDVIENTHLCIAASQRGMKETEITTQEPFYVGRSIALASDVDPAKVEAKLEDGLLRVTVAKLAKPAPRRVVVS